jgi:hypothetical protein
MVLGSPDSKEGDERVLPAVGGRAALWAVILPLLVGGAVHDQRHPANTKASLADWVRVPRPESGTPRAVCAASARRQWKVSAAPRGGFSAEPGDGRGRYDDLPFEFSSGHERPGERGTRAAKRLPDGWLVGVDVGEFGGGLFWVTAQGTNRDLILSEAVKDLVSMGNELIIVAGRRASESTVVFRLERARTAAWRARNVAILAGYPIGGIPLGRSSALILTCLGGFVIGENEPLRVFSSDYRHFYPNSVAVSPSGSVALGMRHFAVRLTPENGQYNEEWLVPADCRNWELIRDDCVCL